MNIFQRLPIVAAALGHLTAAAAPSFLADKALPNLGLKARILGNSAPEPLPQPKVHTYTVTRGSEKTQHDLYSAYELWYASQHAGQWRDAAGNVMILARPTAQLPQLQDAPLHAGTDHVSREAYRKAAEAEAPLGQAADGEVLAAWVASFTGIRPTGAEKLRTPFNLSAALFFPSDDPKTLMWAFRVKARGAGGQPRPSDWYAAVLRLNDGSDKQKVRQAFEAQFLANAASLPAAGPSHVNASKELVKPKAVGGVAALAGRDEIIRSIENMDGWWYVEAADYIFLSNIRGASGKSLVRELQSTLPALRRAYAKTVAPFSDKAEVNVVRIFDSPEAYANHVGGQMEWSVGCWIPSRRELCILSQGDDSRADKERTVAIIRHEAFHQYLFYASDGRADAVWFNEGHACFFEAAEMNAQKRVEVGEPDKKRTLMANLNAAAQNIPFVLEASHAQFYAGDDHQRGLNYATAWGLVYFLRCGTSAGKAAAYAQILGGYRTALSASGDAAAATREAFKGADMTTFQNAFLDFWRKGGTSKRFRIE